MNLRVRRRKIWAAEKLRESMKVLRRYQRNICPYCGEPMQQRRPAKGSYGAPVFLAPRSEGGTQYLNNLVLAHKRCRPHRMITESPRHIW